MWRWLFIVLASTWMLTACSDDKRSDKNEIKEEQETPAATAGRTFNDDTFGIFPSDAYTVKSETTWTGRKVQLGLEDNDPILKDLDTSSFTVPFLNELDGFGTSAGGWVRFTEPVDRDSVVEGKTAFFGYLVGDEVKLVPSETIVEARQVAFRPDFPLPPNTPSFLATTTGIESREGESFAATEELKQILNGEYEGKDVQVDAELAERIDNMAQRLVDAGHISSKDELNALSVFTTQSIHETTREIAKEIREFAPTITVGDEPCETIEHDEVRRCYITITVRNFTNEDDTISDDAVDLFTESDTYELRATIHLPLVDAADRAEDEEGVDRFVPYDIDKGYPVAIFGHGLTGNGDQAKDIAKYIAPMGIATIGVDAPQHGTHPTKSYDGSEDLDLLQALFGISTTGRVTVNPFQLRDGWRQSNLDKLGLIEAIKAGIDIDGDGKWDLDPDRISYLGASLGSIQGPELLALSPDIELALLAIGGARISDFLRYDGTVGVIALFLAPPKVGADAFTRFLIVLQTAIERGDGVNWGPYILQDRFPEAGDPMHVAMQMSIPDEVVPKETGIMQTRTIGVPIVGTAELPDAHIDVVEGPVSANHASGKTAGVIQLHSIRKMNNLEWRKTSHASSPDSLEALTYWKHIFHTMYFEDTRVPELINPYVVLEDELGEAPPWHYEP